MIRQVTDYEIQCDGEGCPAARRGQWPLAVLAEAEARGWLVVRNRPGFELTARHYCPFCRKAIDPKEGA